MRLTGLIRGTARRWWLWRILPLVLLLVGGCGVPATSQPSLAGTAWRLTGWAEPDPLPASGPITAEFADSRISGSSGVNRYTAGVSTGSDGAFTVDVVASTRMAGPPEAMAAETVFLQRLQTATSYAVDGDTLVIADADGQPSLTFTRE